MSRKKGNVGYLLTLISIVLIIAALLGSFSNLGGVVDKIKDKVSDTDTKDDSSTDKGTASEGTGSSNTNSGDSDVRNVFYYGSSQFKVMTESTSATEGVILFGFESGYDADTKWYCTWSIDEAILENTSCSFIPYDYGSGVTLYDIDECYNYNFQSSNNTYEPVVSGPVGDTHFTHLTHQFSGVGKGNTYVLRMFKYTLTDGETVADVLNEICPYIEFITFCTYANVQFKNPNYGNFSGTLLPPETDTPETDTPETDSTDTEANTYNVSGVWKLNDVLVQPENHTAPIEQSVKVTFEWSDITVNVSKFIISDSVEEYDADWDILISTVSDCNDLDDQVGYLYLESDGRWGTSDTEPRTWDFGTEPQEVSEEFYKWLIANGVKQ